MCSAVEGREAGALLGRAMWWVGRGDGGAVIVDSAQHLQPDGGRGGGLLPVP